MIMLGIGEVYGLNYSIDESLCFYEPGCGHGMKLGDYLHACPGHWTYQHPLDKIRHNHSGIFYLNIRLLAPNESLDPAYVLRIDNGTEIYFSDGGICSVGDRNRQTIFLQWPTDPTICIANPVQSTTAAQTAYSVQSTTEVSVQPTTPYSVQSTTEVSVQPTTMPSVPSVDVTGSNLKLQRDSIAGSLGALLLLIIIGTLILFLVIHFKLYKNCRRTSPISPGKSRCCV